jgi:hypothetical protein
VESSETTFDGRQGCGAGTLGATYDATFHQLFHQVARVYQ